MISETLPKLKQTRYYLDTNIIRKTGKRLVNLRHPFSHFTSALTVIELLNGVRSSSDADRRFICLRRIYESRIGIIWALPQSRMADAFDALTLRNKRNEEDAIKSLRSIFNLLIRCGSRIDFLKQVENLDVTFCLDWFENYDTELEDDQNEIVDQYKAMRTGFEHEKDKPSGLLPNNIVEGNFREFCQAFAGEYTSGNIDLDTEFFIRPVTSDSFHKMNVVFGQNPTLPRFNYLLTIYAISKTLASIHNTGHSLVFTSYNRSIEAYVRGLAISGMTRAGRMAPPHRNSTIDLGHFFFLHYNTVLVTEDKDMAELAEQVGIETKDTEILVFNE